MTRNKQISELSIFQVNAFAEGHLAGNPAGVCLLPAVRNEEFYRKVAIEMGLSETAFLVQELDVFNLRWFTRGGFEVDLCGHATLAAAYILWKKGYVNPYETISFHTKSGVLKAKLDDDYVTMEFPLEKLSEIKSQEYDFERYTGLIPLYVGRTRFDYFLVVDSEESVINLRPDFNKLKKIQTRGIIVTAKSNNPEYDFVSRFFAPSVGIDEDPVTGSAHCALGPYWSAILNKQALAGYQASKEGGIVRVEVLKSSVLLRGSAREVPVSKKLLNTIESF